MSLPHTGNVIQQHAYSILLGYNSQRIRRPHDYDRNLVSITGGLDVALPRSDGWSYPPYGRQGQDGSPEQDRMPAKGEIRAGSTAHYFRLFEDLQRKDISGILHVLCNRHHFHGKWTILAKAFSVIRDDKGKKNASLEAFLIIGASFVEIVPINRYLTILGFEIILDDDGAARLRQDPGFNIADISSSMI